MSDTDKMMSLIMITALSVVGVLGMKAIDSERVRMSYKHEERMAAIEKLPFINVVEEDNR